MSVLKTSCPDCDAKLRLSVDGPGDHEVECPKCGSTFTATLADDAAPKQAVSGTSTKAAKRRDDDNDAPKKKKKKKGADAGSGNKKLLVAGGVGGLLLVVAVVGIVIATSGDGKKPTPVANNTPQQPPQLPANPPSVGGPGAPSGAPPKKDTNPPPTGAPGTNGSTGAAPTPPPKKETPPPKKGNDEERLPDPPKVRVSGSLAPENKATVVAPVAPPLAPEEDPFNRAKEFKPEGALPTLPKLPPIKERPLLALESGGHTAFVGKVFFTPKGDRIITVGEDKSVRIWDPATNETIKTLRFPAGPGREGSLLAAAMSRNGKRLAVAGVPLKTVPKGKVPIYIVNPEDGRQVAQFNSATDTVRCMHFSNDGNRLAIGNEDGSLQVFNANSGAQIGQPFSPSPAPALEFKFNPNPKLNFIATLAEDRYVLLVNLSNPSQRREFPVKGVVPTSLAWSTDGQFLAVGTEQGTTVLYTATGELVRYLPPLVRNKKPVPVYQLQFMPGDTEIAVVGGSDEVGGMAALIDSNTGKPRVECKAHTSVVRSVDVSPDGSRIVSSGGNAHEALVWDADDAKVLHRMAGSGQGVWAIAWSKDGRSIAWGNNGLKDNDTEEYPLEHTFRLDEFGLGGGADPSKYVQMVKKDGGNALTVRDFAFLVETPGRPPRGISISGEKKIYSATLLPKGNAIVVGCTENLYLVNPVTLEGTRTFTGHTGHVRCVTPSPDGRYFATGSSDQTIRIWERSSEEPVLSIFVAGRDWIAWTPQGYYACSGQGERLISWVVPGGPNKPPVTHPAERFRPSMYQPALLKYLIPAGDMARALAMAQKYDKVLVSTQSVADVIPPDVTLDGFGDTEVKVEKDTVTVKGKASSAKHPITALRLLVDGRPFMGTAGVRRFEGGQKEAEASWDVSLAPGHHTFAVIADTPVSKGISKVGLAFRTGEVPKPDLYVLAMGVSDYAEIGKLNFCATDAKLISETFATKTGGLFGKVEVKTLVDKQVTKAGMLAGLDWLKSKMTPKDIAIVSFSGHGSRDVFGRFYLCTQDMKGSDPEGTAMPGELFRERLENLPGRIVAILDACHAGSAAEGNRPPSEADGLVRDLTAEDSGVIVLCASLGREYATESTLSKAGFYTLALAEGLSGHGDVDGDGLVYLHELNMYAVARVKQLSKGAQNPTLGRPGGIRPFPLAKVPPRKDEPVAKKDDKKDDKKDPPKKDEPKK